MFKTIVQEASSGKQYRLPQYVGVRWKWKLSYDLLLDDASFSWASQNYMAQTLQGFYLNCAGQANNFLYTDPYDNTMTNPLVIGRGDGMTTTFYIYRTLQGGGAEYLQWLTSYQIYIDGVLQTTGFSVANLPARIIFTSALGGGLSLSWSGSWSFLCRMSNDTVDFSHDGWGIWSVKDFEFESLYS
jgi:hypothetical protein